VILGVQHKKKKKKPMVLLHTDKFAFMCMSDIRKLACLQSYTAEKDENRVPIFLYFILCMQ
jgi:hypothetical protein